MRFVSGAFSWAFALVPTAYIGGLLWYFSGFGGGSADGIVASGLGPTVLGLAVVGLILTLPLIVKFIRFASGTNRVPGARAEAAGELSADTQGFDPDAAFANYMRNRDTAPPPPVASEDGPHAAAPRHGGFGRKIA